MYHVGGNIRPSVFIIFTSENSNKGKMTIIKTKIKTSIIIKYDNNQNSNTNDVGNYDHEGNDDLVYQSVLH